MQQRIFSILLSLVLCVPLAVYAATDTGDKRAKPRGEFKGADFVEIPSWFKSSFLDIREDIADATESGKRVMIYFHQNGCPYCAKLVKDNFTNEQVVSYLQKHFTPIDVNMWGDRDVTGLDGNAYSEKSWAAKHKVWFTPTILFFDEQGSQALRINGYYDPEKFMHVLRYVAEKKETQMSFGDYYKQFSVVKKPGKLQHEPFYLKPPHDLARLAKMDRPIAVFFEQAECKECDQLHNNIFRQQDTLDQLARYHVVQLDRWADTPIVTPEGKKTTAKQWASELNIAYLPSAVMFDEGKEVIRIEGFLKAFHVQSVLDYASSGAYKKEPSLQRFIEHRADVIRGQGKTVDLWK
ncbi:MAG: thioredoxin fold domain-containing protein [Granulosicoccaceae bacterium]|jgi:thioredoxin-related protein